MAKSQNWWFQKVGSKPNTQSGRKSANTKAVVGKSSREKIPADMKCAMCKKAGGCKCRQAKSPRIGHHQPVGTSSRKPAPGTCSCGAYTFANGRCRDRTCSNY